ncbi:MAG TPA: winged helix-turn-helix domain-containing protein, partial [Rhizobiaceae bacterium]
MGITARADHFSSDTRPGTQADVQRLERLRYAAPFIKRHGEIGSSHACRPGNDAGPRENRTINLPRLENEAPAGPVCNASGGGQSICFGPFRLTASSRLLERDGAPLAIGGRALDLLIALTSRPGEILSVRELLALVWPRVTVEEANLRVCVAALRKALRDGREGARYVINVAGRGYMFAAPVGRSYAGAAVPATMLADPERPAKWPAPIPLMVGRDEAVDALAPLLLSRRFVTVVGPGGIGKTTVAIAVADAVRDRFAEDCACFVDLGLQSDQGAVSHALAAALGCDVDDVDPEASLAGFLADKKTLIILDNCEHLIEAVASL